MSTITVPYTPETVAETKFLIENSKLNGFFSNPEALLGSSPCFVKTSRVGDVTGRRTTAIKEGARRTNDIAYVCVLHTGYWCAELFQYPGETVVNIVVELDKSVEKCSNLTAGDIKRHLNDMVSGR